MVKLLPMIGSRNVLAALVRQVPAGSVAGKKTVNPRFAFTTFQSVIVLGTPLAGSNEVAGVVVAPGVGVVGAASSRKIASGLPHQCTREVLTGPGVAVPPLTTFKPEQAVVTRSSIPIIKITPGERDQIGFADKREIAPDFILRVSCRLTREDKI